MSETVTAIKEKGNACLKENKCEEAVLHYTHALRLDPKNYILHSNRSLAFLKMEQYYLAMEDANETIRLKPDWAKGYFRKGEIEYKTHNFKDAVLSYKIALALDPLNPELEKLVVQSELLLDKENMLNKRIPWVGASIGLFLGLIIVIADQSYITKRSVMNPVFTAVIVIGAAVMGFYIAKTARRYVNSQKTSLLEPPVELFKEKQQEREKVEEKEHREFKRHTKAQGRHKFKKGKV